MVLKDKKFETMEETIARGEDEVEQEIAQAKATKSTKAATQTQMKEESKMENTTVEATPTSTEVATTASTAVAPKQFQAALAELRNAIDIDTVRNLGSGVLPKIPADRAGFSVKTGSEEIMYGDWIDFQIISYNHRWLISAGVDGEEGKAFLKTSYDGVELEEGEGLVADYVQELKEQGYPDARSREYIDIYGFVVGSEKGGDVEESDMEMVQLQLSPQSVKAFTGYLLKAGVTAKLTGKQPSDKVRVTTQRREYNGNKYASMAFAAAE